MTMRKGWSGLRADGSGRGRALRGVAAACALAAASLARGQTSGSWVGTAGGAWGSGVNWDVSPAYPGGGGNAVLGLPPSALTGQTVTLNVPVSVGRLTIDSPFQYRVSPTSGGSLTLAGEAVVDVRAEEWAHRYRFVEGHSLTGVTGTQGLTKVGAGTLRLIGPNTYSGPTVVREGTLWMVGNDALGDPVSPLVLDGGTFSTGGLTMVRPITLGAGGGNMQLTDGTIASVIGGSGGLTIGTLWTNSTESVVAGFSGASTFTGPTRIDATQATLKGNGSFARSSSIDVSGYLVLENSGASTVDRIGDAAPVTLRAGLLASQGAGASTTAHEVIGALTIAGDGSSTVSFDSSNQRVSATSLTREGRSTLRVMFQGYAASPTRGLFFAPGGAPALAGSGALGTPQAGVIPWAAEGSRELVTYDPAVGVRPLAAGEYVTTFAGAAASAGANVIISANASVGDAPVTVNSLQLRAPAGQIAPVTVWGAGTIRVTSGAVSASAYPARLTAPLDFGTAEGVFHGGLTVDGVIGGSGGLTIANGGMVFNGANTYTGVTTIAGGFSLSSDVLPGVPGPLGADTSPVVFAADRYSSLLHFSGTNQITFGRDLHVKTTGQQSVIVRASSSAPLTTTSPFRITGDIRLGGRLDVESPVELAGAISGPGTLRFIGHGVVTGNNNTYSGGTLASALTIGGDNALGTGTLYVTDAITLGTLNGAHTLANEVALSSGFGRTDTRVAVNLAGPAGLTFAGGFHLNGRLLAVDARAPLAILGTVEGGSLEVTGGGAGKLILAGANTYTGPTAVTNGGVLNVRHRLALGSAAQPTVFAGGALEIEGGVRDVPEPVQSLAVLRSLGGDNSWAGPVGFASGNADVTVTSGSLTLPAATSAGTSVTKKGGGALRMVNVRTNTLSVQAGALRIVPGGGQVGSSLIQSLGIAAGAVFDLADHVLAVDYATTSPLATVRDYLRTGALTGSGALGYGEASQMLRLSGAQTGSFHGLTVDATTVLVRNTLSGDATLDGRVNFDDLLQLASSYNTTVNGRWTSGDFNYDGRVNFDDLLLLASNYNRAAPTGPVAGGAEFSADVAAAFAAVPEPSALGVVVACGALAGVGRRRRRV